MVLPKKYTRTQEPSVASFNFTDVSTGVGYINLYGAHDEAGNFILTPNTINSEPAGTRDTLPDNSDDEFFNEDFDITFERPLILQGETFVQIPTSHAPSSGSVNTRSQPTITIELIRGSTTKTLVAATTGTQRTNSQGQADVWRDFVNLIKVDFGTTKIKKGDTLRLNLSVTGRTVGSDSSAQHIVWHDPAERAVDDILKESPGGNVTSGDSTQLILPIPVRIDL